MAEKATIAVLGAGGTMGLPMARNLAKAGFAVRAWNRSREKAEPLAQDGATVLDSPQEAVRGADVLLTILSNTDAVTASAEPALQAEHDPNLIWLQMSTIGEAGTERCLELAREHGVAFVDAPVVGTKAPAEQGKLIVLSSGSTEPRDRMQPIFDAVAQRTITVGDTAGESTKLKLAVNAWLVSIVEGAAEALALAEGLGLDPHLLLETLEGGPLDLPYLQMKGKAMLEGDFAPSFKLALASKDAGLVLEAAQRRDLDLPMLDAIRQRFEEGVEEHGEKDMSATFLTSARKATSR